MDKIAEQLPAVGITAASLTLVFLGFLIASWESFDTTARDAVRNRFRTRAWLALSGIVTSLLAVLFGFIGMATAHQSSWADYAGAICLGIWGVVTLWQAIIALVDFG